VVRALTAIVLSSLSLGWAGPAIAMTLYVTTPSDGVIALDVEPSDSIENVKTKIEDQIFVKPDQQWLRFGRTLLEDGRTLSDYSIKKNDTIRLLLSPNDDEEIQLAIAMWHQGYVRVSAEQQCAPGWGASWAQWPNGGTGGWTCERTLPALG
jgi:hypothetical protein